MAAFSALLRRGATTYVLLVADEWSPPKLEADISVLGGTGTADPRLVRESLGSPVQLSVPLRFRETSQVALQAEIDALDAYLRLGECTLEVSFTDAAAATIWTVYHAQPVQPPFTRYMNVAHELTTQLSLLVSPFVTAAAVTLYDAEGVTAPDSLSLSAMTGNYKAPLTIDCDATADDTHSLYLAIDASTYDDYLSDAVDLTWSGGETDTEDVDARSGNAAYVLSTAVRTAAIDTAGYPEGPYLLLARVKALGGVTGYITTFYTEEVVSFTRATWHIVELGDCYLPTRKVRNAGAADLTVSLYGSSEEAGDYACLDWVYALPKGDGMFAWHPSTATIDATTIGRDAATATTYIDDVADEQHVTGNTLMAAGGTLLVVAENASGDDPMQALDVTVTYSPRFAWMR